ncbi:MAG: NAD(P)/FAD-dependent oxidoreductase [Microbacteriaceae bacterium]|nr:NAD(P)/FAD-dependent oxidoreductase [Microbacteriaceae bacterium]
MTDVDAVVVGAGVNGLVAAVRLAEAGMRVVVLEAQHSPGGAFRTEELTLPGFRHDVGATVHALAAASPAFRALCLPIEYAHPEVPLGHALVPGRSVLLHRSAAETAAGLGPDRRHWERVFGSLGRRWEGLVASVLDPTALPPTAPRELVEFGLRGVWPLTRTDARFRSEEARALLSGLAAHAVLPLDAPVTAGFALFMGALAHGVGWPVARGGSQSIVDALVARLREHGGELLTGHPVSSLAGLPSTRAVLLDLTPRQLVAVARDALPPRFAHRMSRWRHAPGVVKVDWALDAPVPWADAALARAGTVHVGGSAASVREAERAAGQGRIPEELHVLFVQASSADPTRAPAGKHTGWGYVHVPNGWDGDLTDAIENRIEQFAPGFRERIAGRHIFTTATLERWDANLVGGDIGGGSVEWRQLIARPRLGPTPWAIPTRRGDSALFLCSSGALPGGGGHGMAGWKAAGAALRRLG